MSEFAELVLSDAEDRMDKAIAHSRSDFASVRSGRANPQLVERLSVEAYGVAMRLVELASVSVPEARQLLVTPHDPANLDAVERAIRVSDLGVSP
ncbi:MAG: ribosome recycling factor, partial [Acidimicrobiia bacterium]|nr:ribosome recycling factor [Acidimicrobiia bacterium]